MYNQMSKRCGQSLKLAAALLALAIILIGASVYPAKAQSSVRPPADAVQLAPDTGPEGGNVPGNVLGNRSDAEIWHAIRRGFHGTLSNPTPEAAQLIQSEGETWRLKRAEVITYGSYLLLGVLLFIAIFFVIRGRVRIHSGRSGRLMPRFSTVQRTVHWVVAILFVILGLSGLILLFGRVALIPLIGPEVFGTLAAIAILAHNYSGPVFAVSIIALLVTFIHGNGYRLYDLMWVLKGGGFLGGHASAGRYNFGEKTWFWWSIILGIVVSITGLLMLFPTFLPEREVLQAANLVHAGGALLFMAFGFGHMYLGTIGMEGALEGMTRGTVDENWAKEHHDLWYQDYVEGKIDQPREQGLEAAPQPQSA